LGWKYWKPLQCGFSEEASGATDSDWVRNYIDPGKVYPEAYRFCSALSPHAAAAIEDRTIHLELLLKKGQQMNHTIIEGAGGLLVPLNQELLLIDLIQKLKCQTLLVVRSGLGTINHTLLSIEALRSRHIEPLGIIMVGDPNPANRQAIQYYGNVKVLGEIPMLQNINRPALCEAGKLINLKENFNEYCEHAQGHCR
jgi:dethiobiotin synthase